jgi:hypothetical protein
VKQFGTPDHHGALHRFVPLLQQHHKVQQCSILLAQTRTLRNLCKVAHLACRRNKEAVYKFSQVFLQEADQADIYEGTTAALVRS